MHTRTLLQATASHLQLIKSPLIIHPISHEISASRWPIDKSSSRLTTILSSTYEPTKSTYQRRRDIGLGFSASFVASFWSDC